MSHNNLAMNTVGRRSPAKVLLTIVMLAALLASAATARAQSGMRINEVQFVSGDSPQGEPLLVSVELYNTVSTAESVGGHTLTNAAGASIATLPALNVPAGGFLTVRFGTGTDDTDFSDGEGTYFTQGPGAGIFAFEEDECGLYPGDPTGVTIVDYLGWSLTGNFTGGGAHADAIGAGIWTAGEHVDLSDHGQLSTLGLTPDGFDNNEPSDWREFDWGTYQTTGSGTGAENPIQILPAVGGLLEETAPDLVWAGLPGATAYELDVDDDADFSSPEIALSTTDTSYSVTNALPDGEYFWRVRVRDGADVLLEEHAVWSFVKIWDAGARGVTVDFAFVPNFSPVIQHKDTDLLCTWNQCPRRGDTDTRPGCSEAAGANGPWDAEHPTAGSHVPRCEHCSWYCSRAAIQMVNNRYGGTLSQDRISYRMFNSLTVHPEGDLGHNCGTFLSQRHEAYAWSLNLEQAQVIRTAGKPAWATIMAEVDAGRPIYIDGANHATVLHGYVEYTTLFGVLRAVVIANPWPGQASRINYNTWQPDNAGWGRGAYFTLPAGSISGLAQESGVSSDLDSDAVKDFDEDFRFQASSASIDSDADQINDKNEIRNYTFHDTYHVTHNNDALTFADSDNDGLRAEADCDSDTPLAGPSDGEFDGGEDIDGDGHCPEAGETCLFDNTSSDLSISVNKDVYFVGELVSIIDFHGTRESHTFHANSTYSYEVEADCPVKESGSALTTTGTFDTDAGGHANQKVVSECQEPGTFHLTVDILGDGLYMEPECKAPQTCWECQKLLWDSARTPIPDTIFSESQWQLDSVPVATTFSGGFVPDPGDFVYDSTGTTNTPDSWTWHVDYDDDGRPIRTNVDVNNLDEQPVAVGVVVSPLFFDTSLNVDLAADSYELLDSSLLIIAEGNWSQYPNDIDPALEFQPTGIMRRNFRTCTCPGDLDGSGHIDGVDSSLFSERLLNNWSDPCADISLDGVDNGLDVQFMADAIRADTGAGTPCPLDPVGACCLDGDLGCQEGFTQEGCTGADGEYQGNNTVCADVVCPGACCHPDGSCTRVPESECDGAFSAEQTCEDVFCIAFGACCHTNGTCAVKSVVACLIDGGTYKGHGTTCAEAGCSEVGACCHPDGTCSQTFEAACDGTFFVGQACIDVTCIPTGACCELDGTCAEVTVLQCSDGTFSAGQFCAQVECIPTGACCVSGVCVDGLQETECGGVFSLGQTCAEVPCLEPGTGACCHADGSCTIETEGACDGTFLVGVPCEQVNCQDLTGACCYPDGSCTVESAASCDGIFSLSLQCEDVTCQVTTGACCFADGLCVGGQQAAECGGTFFLGQSCDDVTCQITAGACCFADGLCVDGLQESECGGIFSLGQSCAEVTCGSACCYLDGTCQEQAEEDCGGQFFTGQQCEDVICPVQTGACCPDESTCFETTQSECAGTFELGVSCVDAECASNIVYWNTDSDGAWGDGTKWSTGSPPGPGQHAVIDRPAADVTVTHATGTSQPDTIQSTETIDLTGGTLNPTAGSSAFHSLNISGGTLTSNNEVAIEELTLTFGTMQGGGNVTVQNQMNWTGGTQTDAGTTTIAAGAAINMSGSANKTLQGGRTLDNAGSATLTDGGSLFINSGATFNNLTGATFDLQDDAPFEYFSGAFTTFNNDGTFTKSGGTGSTLIEGGVRFNNDGTVNIQTGTLRVFGGGNSSGTWTISGNAGVEFGTGTYTLDNGTSVGGDGTASLAGATLVVPATQVPVANFDQTSGTLSGTGELLITSSMNWTGGTQTDSGTTSVADGATFNVSGTGAKSLSGGRTLNNAGAATMTDSGDLFITSGAVFNNLSGASFDVQSDATFEFFSGGLAAFNNDGGFTKSGGTGVTHFDHFLAFNNDGTVDVQTGTLRFSGGGTSTGLFTTAANAITEFNSGNPVYTLDLGTSLDGSGIYRVTSGSTTINDGVDPAITNLELVGGVLTVEGDTVVASFTQTSGTLDGSGEFTVAQQMNWTGGTQSDDGTTTVAAGATLDLSGSFNKTLQSNRTFNNAGAATLGDNGSLFLSSGATFNNLGGATFDAQSDAPIEYFSGAFTAFNNSGTYTKSGGAGASLVEGGVSFNNDGIVEIQTGTLQLFGGGNSSGQWNLSAESCVEFGSNTYTYNEGTSIAGDGTASLTGATLVVQAAQATVENFDQASGTMSGTGELRVLSNMNWTGGAQSDAGTTTIAAGAALNLSGTFAKTLSSGRTLNNEGSATMTDSGSLFINSGAVFNNLAGANFDAQGDAAFEYFSGTFSAFNNDGTFTKSGGAGTTQFEFGLAFNNDGTVQVQSGTLRLSGGGTSTGEFGVDSGAAIDFNSGSPSYTLDTGTTATGGGIWRTSGGTLAVVSGVNIATETFEVTAGGVDVDGSVTTASLTLAGGSFQGTGDFSATDDLNWTGGSMLEGGTTTIPDSGSIAIGGSGSKILNGRTINNEGAATFSGTGDLFINNGAVFNNLAGASFDVQDDADFAFTSGLAGAFNNAGLFTKSTGPDSTTFPTSIVFSNTGTVDSQAGTLTFLAGYTQTAGITMVTGGDIDVGSFALDIQAGLLGGSGTVFGDGIVSATVGPGGSAGRLEFTGDYEHTSGAHLDIELGGLVPGEDFDVLEIGGQATLDGTLNVSVIDGFTPQLGDSFVIMTFDSLVGDFATYTGLDLAGGLALQPSLSESSLTLTVVQP